MKTLYTSIGRFERRTENYTKEYPVVIISGQEYMLDQQELILWSAMSWRFLKKKDIPRYYLRSLQNCDYKPQRSWEACLSRLVTRGLVVSASGETDYDALYFQPADHPGPGTVSGAADCLLQTCKALWLLL